MLREQFFARFKYVEENELCLQASLLDSRFKRHAFMNNPHKYEAACATRPAQLTLLFHPPCRQMKPQVMSNSISSGSVSKFDVLIWQDFDKVVQNNTGIISRKAAALIEVDNYLQAGN